MPRGKNRRTWVKLECFGVLHGSINWLFTLEEQAVFLKLIPMAASYCKIPGIISDNEGKPLPHGYLAQELHCPLEVLESVIKKGTQDHCIRETDGGLQLVNFDRYQFSEYDRQKPYRQAKRQSRLAEMADLSPEAVRQVNEENLRRQAAHDEAKKRFTGGGSPS